MMTSSLVTTFMLRSTLTFSLRMSSASSDTFVRACGFVAVAAAAAVIGWRGLRCVRGEVRAPSAAARARPRPAPAPRHAADAAATHRLLHRKERQDLQQVVLDDVADDAILVKVAAAALRAEVLAEDDLCVRGVAAFSLAKVCLWVRVGGCGWVRV
jgi:hypothetical protein